MQIIQFNSIDNLRVSIRHVLNQASRRKPVTSNLGSKLGEIIRNIDYCPQALLNLLTVTEDVIFAKAPATPHTSATTQLSCKKALTQTENEKSKKVTKFL